MCGFLGLELLPSLILLPGLVLIWGISRGNLWLGLALTPVAGLLQVLGACAAVALGKRLALPSLRPGIYPVRSAFGLRKWLADDAMILSLEMTNTLYSTLYLLPSCLAGHPCRSAHRSVHGSAHRPGSADAGSGMLRRRPRRHRSGASSATTSSSWEKPISGRAVSSATQD